MKPETHIIAARSAMKQSCHTASCSSRRLSLQAKVEPSRSPTVHQPAERCLGIHRTSRFTPCSFRNDEAMTFTAQLPIFTSGLSPQHTSRNKRTIHSARSPLHVRPGSRIHSISTINERSSAHNLSLSSPSLDATASAPTILPTSAPTSQGAVLHPHHPGPLHTNQPATPSGSMRTQPGSMLARQPHYGCAIGPGEASGSGSSTSSAPPPGTTGAYPWSPSSQPPHEQLGQRTQQPSCSTAAGCRLVEDTTDDNWRMPLARPGSVVALGKFEALHRGHQALATAAAALAQDIAVHASAVASYTAAAAPEGSNHHSAGTQAPDTPASGGASFSGRTALHLTDNTTSSATTCGDAVLLSFSGMAAVLGWPTRLPLTAPQDRGRVLASWGVPYRGGGDNGEDCCPGGGVGVLTEPSAPPAGSLPPWPRLRTLPFARLRSLSPEAFVALLAGELGAAGVVAGRNYRFGYKAAGDADTLVRLGAQYGMRVKIVDLVQLPDSHSEAGIPDGASNTMTETDISSASYRNSRENGADGTAELPAARAEAEAFISGLSTDMEVEDVGPSADAASQTSAGACNRGGSGGGAGGCSQASCRVSSSRIRALLAAGAVGSVEQLLGRKYRLVAELKGGSGKGRTDGVVEAKQMGDSKAQAPQGGSHSHNSRRNCTSPTTAITSSARQENAESRCGSDTVSDSHSELIQPGAFLAPVPATITGRDFVPYSTYQNQPPANGTYRALVAIAAGWEVPVDEADGAVRGSGVGTEPNCGSGRWLLGPMCTTVTLSDDGMDVDPGVGQGFTQSLTDYLGGSETGVPLLLCVDFDTCN